MSKICYVGTYTCAHVLGTDKAQVLMCVWRVLLTYILHGADSFLRSLQFSASQEIPCILWNPKVPYGIHKYPPPIPILSQLDPTHTPHIPLPEDPA